MPWSAPGDPRALGVRIGGVEVAGASRWRDARFADGFHHEEQGDASVGTFRWTDGSARLGVPVDVGEDAARVLLSAPTPVTVTIATDRGTRSVPVGPVPRWIDVELEPDRYDVINNVGSHLSRAGYGGDRGFLERDAGQYESVTDVFAWCGAGVLFRPAYLQDVGLFDERFFMYYEDTDLSWRGRAKGWRYRYVPTARLRHVHAATSVEGSPMFNHYVQRNRLVMVTKNAPAAYVGRVLAGYGRELLTFGWRDVLARLLRGRRPSPGLVLSRARSLAGYVRLLPSTLAARPPHPRPAGRRRPVPPRVVRLKAAVYNRYWRTGGGGEAYGAGLAHVLSQRADVTLLGHEPIDTGWLSDRLQIGLDGVATEVVPDRPGAVTAAGAAFDLFVNVTFMSADAAPHGNSLYVVHFPNPPELGLSKPRKAAIRGLRMLGGMPAAVEYRSGFFDRDPGSRGSRWTTGEGEVRVSLPRGDEAVPITFVFGAGRPEPTDVVVEAAGVDLASVRVGGPVSRARALQGTAVTVHLRGEGPHHERTVVLRSDTFVPVEHGRPDTRELGVPLRGIRVGRGLAAHAETWFPWVGRRGVPTEWQRTYGALVANSVFTADWIRRWWSADSHVLYPPVTMRTRGQKRHTILSVGRFFAAEQGHSKKQLEMVKAFRRLVDSGVRDWTLHLVGGCEEVGRHYLDKVRAAAEGYPVRIHVDATGEELSSLYAEASIYWHASGMGEDVERHPGRLEHFGMTTVEAMSAGAVPVVIGLAGQVETVRDGVDGWHIRDIKEMAERTRMLIGDAPRREQMSQHAEARAKEFSIGAFGEQLWALVDDAFPVEGEGRYGPARP